MFPELNVTLYTHVTIDLQITKARPNLHAGPHRLEIIVPYRLEMISGKG